eukprot:4390144-Prymnesium_polylepis.1
MALLRCSNARTRFRSTPKLASHAVSFARAAFSRHRSQKAHLHRPNPQVSAATLMRCACWNRAAQKRSAPATDAAAGRHRCPSESSCRAARCSAHDRSVTSAET